MLRGVVFPIAARCCQLGDFASSERFECEYGRLSLLHISPSAQPRYANALVETVPVEKALLSHDGESEERVSDLEVGHPLSGDGAPAL